MKTHILIVALILFLYLLLFIHYFHEIKYVKERSIVEEQLLEVVKTPTVHADIVKPATDDLITMYADKYQISPKTLKKVVKCESGFDPLAHKLTKKEDSWGLSQINLKAHKNITKEQAIDPDFSIEYLANNLSQGHSNMWLTCYNL